ncbi:unnamed protein product [Soboliphyme baturini]|uniref:Phosphatidylinositol-glycan biosynthesis class X protein n=1 Tax=Soboliphyme baturini TaxID=241478 RepID=A0A183INF2_9BILA|nr:unnamed protein product [Soboliphyme baturini]
MNVKTDVERLGFHRELVNRVKLESSNRLVECQIAYAQSIPGDAFVETDGPFVVGGTSGSSLDICLKEAFDKELPSWKAHRQNVFVCGKKMYNAFVYTHRWTLLINLRYQAPSNDSRFVQFNVDNPSVLIRCSEDDFWKATVAKCGQRSVFNAPCDCRECYRSHNLCTYLVVRPSSKPKSARVEVPVVPLFFMPFVVCATLVIVCSCCVYLVVIGFSVPIPKFFRDQVFIVEVESWHLAIRDSPVLVTETFYRLAGIFPYIIAAYKSLLAEKEALQSSLAVLKDSWRNEDETVHVSTLNADSSSTYKVDDEVKATLSALLNVICEKEDAAAVRTLESENIVCLRRSLQILVEEKKRQDDAFMADRKHLLARIEELMTVVKHDEKKCARPPSSAKCDYESERHIEAMKNEALRLKNAQTHYECKITSLEGKIVDLTDTLSQCEYENEKYAQMLNAMKISADSEDAAQISESEKSNSPEVRTVKEDIKKNRSDEVPEFDALQTNLPPTSEAHSEYSSRYFHLLEEFENFKMRAASTNTMVRLYELI